MSGAPEAPVPPRRSVAPAWGSFGSRNKLEAKYATPESMEAGKRVTAEPIRDRKVPVIIGLMLLSITALALGLGLGLSSGQKNSQAISNPAPVVEMSFIVDGTVESFTLAVRNDLISKVATELNVSASVVTLTVEPASVRLIFAVTLPNLEEANSAVNTLTSKVATTSEASTFLSTESLAVNVVSITKPPAVQGELVTPVNVSLPVTSSPSLPPPPPPSTPSGHGHANTGNGHANGGSRRLTAIERLPALDELTKHVAIDELWAHDPKQGGARLTRETCAKSVIPQSLALDRVDWNTFGEPKGEWLRRYDPAATERPVCLGRDTAERAKWYEAAFESSCDRPSMVWTNEDGKHSRFTDSMHGDAPALLGLDPSILDYCKEVAGDSKDAPLPTDGFWRHTNTSDNALGCPASIGCKDNGPVSLLESNLLESCTRANRNILRVSALQQKEVSWDMCHNTEWVICAAKGALPHQGPSIQFANPPSRIDPTDQDAFREYRANILRWSAYYEIDTISWTFYEFEVCLLSLLCDNYEEMWSLSRGEPFQCKTSAEGRARLIDAFEGALGTQTAAA